jgi:hypothetical protein
MAATTTGPNETATRSAVKLGHRETQPADSMVRTIDPNAPRGGFSTEVGRLYEGTTSSTATRFELARDEEKYGNATATSSSSAPLVSTSVRNSQAYTTARRQPHLLKLRMHLQRLADADSAVEQMTAIALSREQVERLWEFVDQRDDYTAQYVQLIAGALDEVTKRYARSRADAIIKVVDQVLNKRLDYESRRTARLTLLHAGALKLPEPTLEQASAFELEDEQDEDDN